MSTEDLEASGYVSDDINPEDVVEGDTNYATLHQILRNSENPKTEPAPLVSDTPKSGVSRSTSRNKVKPIANAVHNLAKIKENKAEGEPEVKSKPRSILQSLRNCMKTDTHKVIQNAGKSW